MNETIKAAAHSTRDRHFPLEGGCNFRDIGGYSTGHGRTVRWGRVFRTGVLSYLSSGDCNTLGNLQIKAICDLRRAEERNREPTRWPDPDAEALTWEDGYDMPTIRRFAADRPNTAAGMREAMIELYRALPAWMAPRIRGMFLCIANDKLPLVVHCAAGKDRTGIAVALLLAALGVSRDTILDDYLLTNEAGNFERFIAERRDAHLGLADAHRPLLAMPEEVRRVLFSADTDFLDAALTHIDTAYGGVEGYLATTGIDADTLQRVRLNLLA